MAVIIYEKTPGELIPQGNRTVSTFPSGLIRVDQSFIGATSYRETHRSLLQVGNDMPSDSYPSIDGLKIYPAVQEKRMADGFTEYIVSAFGRTTTRAGDLETKRIQSKFSDVNQPYGYTYLQTSGKATVPVGSSYTFLDTGLEGDYYPSNPYASLYVAEYLKLHLFGKYEKINYLKLYDEYGNIIKLWENRYRVDAITYAPGSNTNPDYPGISYSYIEQQTALLSGYIDPFINILERRNFGSFDEIDFITTILKNDLVGSVDATVETSVSTSIV